MARSAASAKKVRTSVNVAIVTGAGTPYLGPVASRTVVPNQYFNGHFQARSRSVHIAKADIVALKLVTGNWYIDSATGNLLNSGQQQTDTAAFEYPAGGASRAQVTWSGSPNGITAAGANLESDWCPVTIPKGALFAVRRWIANAGGVAWTAISGFKSLAWGEAFGSAASGVTDNTMTAGSVPDAGNAANSMGPAAILGMTDVGTILYLGDSLWAGLNDTLDASGDFGLGRYLDASYGYINASRSGDRVMWLNTQGSTRIALAKYVSHVIVGESINDLANGQTAAQTRDSLISIGNQIRAINPKARLLLPTSTPDTDGGNTAPNGTTSAGRVALNNMKRSMFAPYDVLVDLADLFENTRDGGLWKVTAHTFDGRHLAQAGNLYPVGNGAISQSLT